VNSPTAPIPPSRPELRLNAPLVPVLAGVFALLYGITGYRGWLVFLVGTGGAWLLAYIWVHSLRKALQLERKVHLAWAQVGDSVPEELTVSNRSRMPAVWLEIADISEAVETPLRLVADVEAQGSLRRHPVHAFKRRGLYRLGPTRLRTGDPFGIYRLSLVDAHSSSVLVTPPQVNLSHLPIASGGWAGDRERQRRALERHLSQAGVRKYLPGDSLRRIHWPATAHSDSLIVRPLESAASGDWWLFVDLDAAAQAGSGLHSTLELSIVLAASLIRRGLAEHRRVGLTMAGPGLVRLEPHSDPAHTWQLMRALAMAETGNHPLPALLALGQPAQTASLIVITAATDPGWTAGIGRHNRGGSTTALLVDPRDFGGSQGQEGIIQALTQRRIPFQRMPGSLLEAAYAPLQVERRRYLEEGRAAWHSLD
jgi:uncharacterized protein (DUF58 family)